MTGVPLCVCHVINSFCFGKTVDRAEMVSLEPLTGLVMTVCLCALTLRVIEGSNEERDEYFL